MDGTFLYLLFPNKEVEGCCFGHNNRAGLYSPTEFVTPPLPLRNLLRGGHTGNFSDKNKKNKKNMHSNVSSQNMKQHAARVMIEEF